MNLTNTIARIFNLIDKYDYALAKTIEKELQNATRDYDDKTHWDSIVSRVNATLNSWLIMEAKARQYPDDIDGARRALNAIDKEMYTTYWLEDIERLWLPVAYDIFTYR
jgi:isoleucyl-tRNA synthetase